MLIQHSFIAKNVPSTEKIAKHIYTKYSRNCHTINNKCQMFMQKITFKRHLLELLPVCKVFNFFYKCVKYIPMPNNVKRFTI